MNFFERFGAHGTFEGFSLEQGYAEIAGAPVDRVKEQSHDFQVYFRSRTLIDDPQRLR